MVPSRSNTHAFDIDAETEPIEETGHDLADLQGDLEDMAVEWAFAEDNAPSIFYFFILPMYFFKCQPSIWQK